MFIELRVRKKVGSLIFINHLKINKNLSLRLVVSDNGREHHVFVKKYQDDLKL